MRKVTWILLILCFLQSCTSSKHKEDQQYFDEFYTVLDNLIRFNLHDVSVISAEILPVYKTIDSISESSPMMYHVLHLQYFDLLKKRYFLDTLDASFMYNSIDSVKTFEIDSNRISIPVINKKDMVEFFSSGIYDGYDKINETYGTSCFIRVTRPIFNSNYTKMILFIDYFCGPLWGQGYQYFLIKKDGNWKIIDEGVTWES